MFIVNFGRATMLAVTVSACALVVGCAGVTEDGTEDAKDDVSIPVDTDVTTQQDDTWTTRNVCTACGCSVSGFVCNCGLRPNPKKLDCIKNGGPPKASSATLSSP